VAPLIHSHRIRTRIIEGYLPKSRRSLFAARVGAYPKSRLSLLELGLTAPQACVASRPRVCYPTLEVALGSASPCPRVAV